MLFEVLAFRLDLMGSVVVVVVVVFVFESQVFVSLLVSYVEVSLLLLPELARLPKDGKLRLSHPPIPPHTQKSYAEDEQQITLPQRSSSFSIHH